MLAPLLMVIATSAQAVQPSICGDCQIQLGLGGTYHFWSSTGGLVVPLTVIWDEDRYEVGLFRMAGSQVFYDDREHRAHQTATPYWGLSASRRWEVIRRPFWRLFFGFGGSYKTEGDELSVTRWNFASQLGLRVSPNNSASTVEVALRHWSNGGIRLPNRGQDFLTVSYAFSAATP